MTIDIAELRRLEAEATKGPWEIWPGNPWHAYYPGDGTFDSKRYTVQSDNCHNTREQQKIDLNRKPIAAMLPTATSTAGDGEGGK